MYDQEIQIIKEFFSRKFLHAVPGWIEGCAEFFVSNNRNYSCNQLQEFAFEQWKLADLKEMGTGCLPPNLNTTLKTVLQGKYAIQIEWIRDIGHASYAQLRKIRQSNNANEDIGSTKPQSWEPRQSRMIQIRISDGQQSILGIEYKRVPVFDQSFCPGTKALISGPVECRRGILLLEEHNVQIMGGEVDSLIINNAPENILARVLGLPVNPNPNINFNPGNENETQDESRSTQQTSSFNGTTSLQQGSLPNGTRSIQQAPSSSSGSLSSTTTPSSNAARPVQRGTLSSTNRTIQQSPSSSEGYLSSTSRTVQNIPQNNISRNVQQMPPPSSTRTMGQNSVSNTSRTFQQIPQTNTSRTFPQPNMSQSRSVTNRDQDFSRGIVDNSGDLLNDEEILGEDMLAHLSALENEYLSEKEPPEVIGAFNDEDFIEEPSNINDDILSRIPDVHIAEETFRSSNASAKSNDKNKKRVTFGPVEHKPQITSQKKITNYISPTPVKQQPSTSLGRTNYTSHTNASKENDFMSDKSSTSLRKTSHMSHTDVSKENDFMSDKPSTSLWKTNYMSHTDVSKENDFMSDKPSTSLRKTNHMSHTDVSKENDFMSDKPSTSLRKTNYMSHTDVSKENDFMSDKPSTSLRKTNYMSHTDVSKENDFMSDKPSTSLGRTNYISHIDVSKENDFMSDKPSTSLGRINYMSHIDVSKENDFMSDSELVNQEPSTSLGKTNYMSHTHISKEDDFMTDKPSTSLRKTNCMSHTDVSKENDFMSDKPSTSLRKTNYMSHTHISKEDDFMNDLELDSEFTEDKQVFSSETFHKAPKPQSETSRNSSSELSSDCTSLVTSSSPFVYLKQIKIDTNITKTYRAKVFILTLISELELKDDEWVLYAKLCDGTANLDTQLSSSVMEKILNLPKETLLKWKPHIQTNKEVREELKMRMKTAEDRLIHFNNLVDIKVEPGKKIPCVTAIYEVTAEDMRALKLRLEYIREKCEPKT